MIGSDTTQLVINPDMSLDQPNEGATVTLSTGQLAEDRWRFTGNVTGQSISTHRSNSLMPLNTGTAFGNRLVISSGASATIGASQSAYIAQNIEGGPWTGTSQWGQLREYPLELEFCALATTGTYDVVLWDAGKAHSYVHRVALTGGTSCYSTVIPPPPETATVQPNNVALTVGFDLGADTAFQTSQADVWLTGEYHEYAGDYQLVANNTSALHITGVHLRSGPFSVPYQPRTAAQELTLAREFFQKSLPPGTQTGQNRGVAGAVTMTPQVANIALSQYIQFNPPLYSSPTVTVANPSATNTNCRDATSAADYGAASSNNVSMTGFNLACAAGTASVGDLIEAHWWADSGN
jgi:hypothetical protein